jgi:energy-coupling factor transporter ATP-binding protein EcfA2
LKEVSVAPDGDAIPLRIRDLTFRYRIREEPAIRDLSLDLHAGELMLVAGTSGCGKTTLIRCVNGLIPRSYRGRFCRMRSCSSSIRSDYRRPVL